MNFQILLDIARLERLVADLQRMKLGAISAESLGDIPSLSFWSFSTRAETCLQGVVQDHPSLPDGHEIKTSQLFAHYVDGDRQLVRTLNRWYQLGS